MYLEVALTDNLKKYSNYKLCYVESISWANMNAEDRQYKAPAYIKGKQEYIAYFTPIDLSLQRGEDWDTQCSESEPPYDTIVNDDGSISELNILVLPFAVHSYGPTFAMDAWRYYWDGVSVIDINNKAVSWIYDYNEDNNKSVAIYAGVCPHKFKKLLNEIRKNNPKYTTDE